MKTVQIRRMLGALWAEQDGVTAIEYAVLAALIFGAIVVSVGLLAGNVADLYDNIADIVSAAIP